MMKFIFIFIFTFSFVLFHEKSLGMDSQAPWIRVYDEIVPGKIFNTYVELNLPIVPITVKFVAKDVFNCNLGGKLPLTIRIDEAGKKLAFSGLMQVDPMLPYRCYYSWSYLYGTEETIPVTDCSLHYPLDPGVPSKIIQGANSGDTHQGDSAHAVDYAVPEGTRVLAAHEGVVAEVMDEVSNELEGGNYIVLLHQNGYLSMYSHLKEKSLKVKRGQLIKAGEVIAESGQTGSRLDKKKMAPHLHFDIFKYQENKRVTIPFNLKNKTGCSEFF
jgi:murein DD-endopeptidase MepM/ murein hydrolase activator NlpD